MKREAFYGAWRSLRKRGAFVRWSVARGPMTMDRRGATRLAIDDGLRFQLRAEGARVRTRPFARLRWGRRLSRRVQPRLPGGDRHRRHRPARPDDPGNAVHGLSDDARRHHGGAGRGRIRPVGRRRPSVRRPDRRRRRHDRMAPRRSLERAETRFDHGRPARQR